MRLFATQNVEGLLTTLPDPRLAPTPFAETADARAATVGMQLDNFLAALGLTPGGQAANALATPAIAEVKPEPFWKNPVFLVGASLAVGYVLHKRGVI